MLLIGCVSQRTIPLEERQHLELIRVPSFDLTNATITEAISALHNASVKYDPTPYDFGVRTTYSVKVSNSGDPFVDLKWIKVEPHQITMRRKNVCLLKLIQEVCEKADMAFDVPVHGYVLIIPKEGCQPSHAGDGKSRSR